MKTDHVVIGLASEIGVRNGTVTGMLHGINTLRSQQNGWHFADNILNALSFMKANLFQFKAHWSLFLRMAGIFQTMYLKAFS